MMKWTRNSLRFPEQTIKDLASLKYVYLVVGAGWVVFGIFQLPGWRGYPYIILGILWGTLFLAAKREIRRRQESSPSTK